VRPWCTQLIRRRRDGGCRAVKGDLTNRNELPVISPSVGVYVSAWRSRTLSKTVGIGCACIIMGIFGADECGGNAAPLGE
jgi:hypothetical protein